MNDAEDRCFQFTRKPGERGRLHVNGAYTGVMYTPVGKTAITRIYAGSFTTLNAYFPLPGGATYYQTGSANGSGYFWHKDWLGSVRLSSSVLNRTYYFDRAFAPYGEMYKNFGNTAGINFTGDTQDSFTGLFDTPNRELHPGQGRWISPDPAGLSVVDRSNPQSWNRYAYVVNRPLATTDPLGTCDSSDRSPECRTVVVDGVVEVPASVWLGVLSSGAGSLCPGNTCSGINKHGLPMQYKASSVAGYYAPLLTGAWPSNIKLIGNVYKMQNGKYSWTLPLGGDSAASSISSSDIPAGTTYAGNYHDHGAFDIKYANEQFSAMGCNGGHLCDIGNYLSLGARFGLDQVLFGLGTPEGRIEIFDPSQVGTMPFGCVLVGSAVAPGPGSSSVAVPTCH